jgi:hypothetical protein
MVSAFLVLNQILVKPNFLKKLYETLLATDGSQVVFQDILKKHEGKRWL